ncbi:hypothetical protein NC652_010160 [Populus alba x Populus x berolinensis]|nr:hypothetical protein NC652_010160 [Populus alba x Populus x berolinensis]
MPAPSNQSKRDHKYRRKGKWQNGLVRFERIPLGQEKAIGSSSMGVGGSGNSHKSPDNRGLDDLLPG